MAREPLPLEFRLLNFKPEPWIPADSLAWVKMMCWNLCVNWETEILRARLIAKLGAETAASLEPSVPPEWVRVIPPGVDYSCIGTKALKHAAEARQFTGPAGRQGIGSNNWVLSGTRTNTGMPILANDRSACARTSRVHGLKTAPEARRGIVSDRVVTARRPRDRQFCLRRRPES